MKMLNQEQFSEMMTDLSEVIGAINLAKDEFNGAKMRREIVDEFKKYLNSKNTLLKSLENESLDLELNLIALRNVKKEFIECRKESELRLMFYSLGSMLSGGLFAFFSMWFMGKF
jgi:hypothetical protein